MSIVKAIFQILCTLLLVLLVVASQHAVSGFTAGELWGALCSHIRNDHSLLIWTAIIALQLGIMKWQGGLWNIIFCWLSLLLIAGLVMLAAGPSAAVTAPVYAVIESAGYTDVTAKYPLIYWLLPLLWFLACLCAGDQVRVFLTAIICYALWLLLSWLFGLGVQTWLSMGEPAPAQLATLFRNHLWIVSVLPGIFILIYATLVALLEACLSRRSK